MNELNVALYKGATPEIITLEEYVEALQSGKMDFHVNFDHATLSLKRDGVESLAHLISLGPLGTMLPQLDHLVERISGNEHALLRSGVLDVSEGHFLLVEPAHPGQDEVFVSLVSIPEFPASHWFPAGENGPRLYAHVLARLKELAERAGERGYPFRVPVGKALLLESLRRNQRAAQALPPPAQPRA